MADIKPGDLYEIRVKGKWNDDYTITEGELADLCIKNRYEFDGSDAVHVEKIEPPIEVFGRGDTVRAKVSGNLWSIGIDGVFDHCTGVFVSGAEHAQGFTSKHFERVNLW